MGEDIPLDPNQVEPPQEGDATQIEVNSHEGEQSSNGDPTQLDSVDHDGGPDSTPDEEQVPATFIRDEEKAEVMAHAQNDALDAGEKFPQNTALRAGNEYDINIAKSKTHGYEPY